MFPYRKIARVSWLAASVVLVWPGVSEAQSSRGSWLVTGGYRTLNRAALEDELRAAGYDLPASPDLALGLAAEVQAGRLRLGVEADRSLSTHRAGDDAGNTSSWSRWGGGLSLGVVVVEPASVPLFPFVGIGLQQVSVELEPAAPPILAAELAAYTDPTVVSRTGGVLRLGLGSEVLIPLVQITPEGAGGRRTREGISVSIQGGWQLGFAEGDWSRQGASLGSQPGGVFDGPFVRLGVGYGSVQERSRVCPARCPERPNTRVSCRFDSCRYSCLDGQGDCDGRADNGCETVLNRLDACGACGEPCAIDHGTPTCSIGTCEVASCEPGWANCNGVSVDGCEANLQADPGHCGACEAACRAGQRCEAGSCAG